MVLGKNIVVRLHKKSPEKLCNMTLDRKTAREVHVRAAEKGKEGPEPLSIRILYVVQILEAEEHKHLHQCSTVRHFQDLLYCITAHFPLHLRLLEFLCNSPDYH